MRVTAREDAHRLHLLIWLKSFQRLGYFPVLADVPVAVVVHLRTSLNLPATVQPGYDQPRMLYRHQEAVRAHQGVQPFGPAARQAAVAIVGQAAAVMDNPADLINVALEELVRLRYELPAFSTLDRLVAHERTRINTALQAAVLDRLTAEEIAVLQSLLDEKASSGHTPFQRIKDPPERATLKHLREWQAKLTWLLTLGETDRLLTAVPPAKVAHFAAEATALDASDLGDVAPAKRYTLLLCLIHRARIGVRDELATMLIKRMSSIQRAAQEDLVRLRESHLATTLKVVSTLEAVLDTLDDAPAAEDEDLADEPLETERPPARKRATPPVLPDPAAPPSATAADAPPGDADPAGASAEVVAPTDAERMQQLRELFAARGGLAELRKDCATVASYNSQNHLPLLWPCFQSHRAVLFAILRTLTIQSTTQDQALCKALAFILAHQHKRGAWLPRTIDLSFASEAWLRLVLVRRRVRKRRKTQIVRRQLEVCVFTYLAHELKTGDLCVVGSEQYADYRTHLLPWSECAPQVADYCRSQPTLATSWPTSKPG